MFDRREACPNQTEAFNKFVEENLVRLAALARAKGLAPDRASATAVRAVLGCREEIAARGALSSERIAKLYSHDLGACIADEACEEHFKLIAAIIARRFGLDPDQSSHAANEALYSWRKDLERHGRLASAVQYLPQLYGQILKQRALDEVRKKRRELLLLEGLDRAARLVCGELSEERPSDEFSLSHDIEQRMTRFFLLLDESDLRARFQELRRVARIHGHETLAGEFLFVRHYLFENKAEEGAPARRELTRELGWNLKPSTRKRLREKLKAAWEQACRSVFIGQAGLPEAV
jgi:hypothetical protein